MTRTYQPKYLQGGEPNPRFVVRHRPSGTQNLSKFSRGEFVAWDGEGVTIRKRHQYVMLMNSQEAGTLVNPTGIPTRDALETLCEVGQQFKHSIHVVFGGSYDVNMILGDCTYEQVQSIWAGLWTPVCGGRYSVSYRARKSFSIRRVLRASRTAGHGSDIVLWDVFGFFQATFVDAMEKFLGTSDELELIRIRKAQRSTFKMSNLEQIKSYCALECRSLVKLMEMLRDNLAEANLPIRRWDGAGACAASLLQREQIVNHKRSRDDTPDGVLYAAQAAYAGGRTELVRYGHAPKTRIHHYDINSAYPAAMRECPSLTHGTWSHRRGAHVGSYHFAMYHVRWAFDDADMYPFFWRAHDTSIYYPQKGEGWCWFPELAAARDAITRGVLRGSISVLESWTWQPTVRESPFMFLDDLFIQRAQWKRDGVGAEKALKLAINSCYGKTAQHIGGSKDAPPRFHQLEWAGYITSKTRAMVYRACTMSSKKKARIIMVATDGVYSLDALTLPCSKTLGEWDAQEHQGITVAQSGVYWTDEGDGSVKMYCRGFDKGTLVRGQILRSWRQRAATYDATLTRFVTMGSGLVTRDAFATRWRQWRTCPRVLKLSPDGTKRYTQRAWTRAQNPAQGLMLTRAALPAAQVVGQVESAAYPLPWDTDNEAPSEMIDGASARVVETEHYDAML